VINSPLRPTVKLSLFILKIQDFISCSFGFSTCPSHSDSRLKFSPSSGSKIDCPMISYSVGPSPLKLTCCVSLPLKVTSDGSTLGLLPPQPPTITATVIIERTLRMCGQLSRVREPSASDFMCHHSIWYGRAISSETPAARSLHNSARSIIRSSVSHDPPAEDLDQVRLRPKALTAKRGPDRLNGAALVANRMFLIEVVRESSGLRPDPPSSALHA